MATSRPVPLFDASPRWLLAPTLFGLAVWAVLGAAAGPGWLPMLFLWAPLVLFPAGLRLYGRAVGEDDDLLPLLGPPAALLAAGAFLPGQGVWAGLLTLPWVGYALGTAVARGHAFARDRNPVGPVLALYWLVGAGWLALARFGLRPLGFSDEIVLATAVHFHYSGFLLPVLVLQMHRPSSEGTRLVAAVLLGVPFVALGITLSAFEITAVEPLATWFLAGVCLVVAGSQWAAARRRLTGARKWCAMGSSLSLGAAMVLAVVYATGNYFQVPALDIPLMLVTHGCLQAFGFAPLGLLAWEARS